jgi:hypothetical protein
MTLIKRACLRIRVPENVNTTYTTDRGVYHLTTSEERLAKATRAVWSATRREAGLITQAQLAERLRWTRDKDAATEAGRRR